MEIEAKFILPDRETLERLESADQVGGLSLSAARPKEILDIYMDTPDRALFSAGYTCRQRHVDGLVLMTLKALKRGRRGVFRREEQEVTLPRELPPAEWPASPARTRVLEIVGNQELVLWLDLRQKRVVRHILDGDRHVGELSLDDACITSNGKTTRFLEVEAELADTGKRDDLDRIIASLKEEWHLNPEPRSKFERALEVVGAAPRRRRPSTRRQSSPPPGTHTRPEHPGIQPDDTMAEAARKTLDFHLRRMLWHEEGVRAGQDREAVHDMRVATRRMRASLRVLKSYVNWKTLKPYVRILRRAGRVLGAVRDMDVFREKAERYLESLPPQRRSELDPLLNAWQEEYANVREELIAFLDSDSYKRLKEEFSELLSRPGALERPVAADREPTPTCASHVLPIILFDALARVQAYEQLMRQPEVSLVRYHQLRITSKWLRYTLEFFQEVLPPEVETAIEQVKQLQDHLGDLQDAVITCNNVRDFLVWGTWGHSKSQPIPAEEILAPGVALYFSVRQTEIENLVKSFPEAWAPIVDPEFRQRIMGLVAAFPRLSSGATPPGSD